jgi:hypothetical protein
MAYSPPARAAGPIPTKIPECICVNIGTSQERCWEDANVYVVCPWAPNDNLDGQNPYKVAGVAATEYVHFTAGSVTGTLEGHSPTSTTNAVIYEIDPQCGDCAGYGPPCRP